MRDNQHHRIHIVGPMESAGGNWNMPLFDFVAKKLREHDCLVFNPAEHLREAHGDLETVKNLEPFFRKSARKDALKDEINWIIDHAQLVLLLPGWERSSRATAERAVALAIGVPVRETGTILLPTGDAPLDLSHLLEDDNLQVEV